MPISASDVKKLRDATGAGMMDCKNALEEAGGDFEKATTILRTKGLASAAKKAGRDASQGLIGCWMSDDHATGILADVRCETDFAANTDDFKRLISDALELIKQAGDNATPEWLADPAGPVHTRVAETIGKVGENMLVPRFVRYSGKGYVAQYIHLGGKIGVQVEFSGVTPAMLGNAEFAALAKEVAMQIAAANPSYAARGDVPADVLEKEKSIYRAQMEQSGKPANVIDKIVEGKLGSFYSQFVLPDQPSIRDPKMTVAQLLAASGKTLGGTLTITRFARLMVGETV
ncbi:MAG TPA: translation elongation factor Ts [Vicinamibacterales bacterium]|jgi:elongation factor Ts|nr:translation elongation factor Ts [Vicinamibacterales bacterium]